MKTVRTLAVILLLIVAVSLAFAIDIPAPFSKAQQYALKASPRIHTDGTTFHRLDLRNGDDRFSLGCDKDCIWIASNQWNQDMPVVITYQLSTRSYIVITQQGEIDVSPNDVKFVTERAFEVFRKLVSLGLI